MKQFTSHLLAAAAACILTLTSCNDYDAAAIGYEDNNDPDTLATSSEPRLDSAWNLDLVINIGQHDNDVWVYRDRLYDAFFTRTLGWNGGDVVASARLSGDRLLWLVRDSYYGTVDADTRARLAGTSVRSSLLLQTCDHGTLSNPDAQDLYVLNPYIQTSDPAAADYYVAETIYYPADTKFYGVPALAAEWNGKVQVLFGAYRNTNSRHVSSALTEYVIGTPAGSSALQQQSHNETLQTNMISFDDCLLADEDGHNYLYCSYLLNGINGVLVARTATHDLGSAWEYYIRDTNGSLVWSETAPTISSGTLANETAQRSNMLTANGSCQHPQVFKSGEWYYLVGQTYSNGQAVQIWRSRTPQGPFSDSKRLCVIPGTVAKQGGKDYNALTRVVLHPALSRSGELVLSTAQTAYAANDNFTYPGSADYVRPYFYRVFNWQSLWEE